MANHLVAGRGRLGVVAAFIVLQQFDIFKFLEGPILPYLDGNKLKYTHPADPFSVLITASVSDRDRDRAAGDPLPGVGVPRAGALQAREARRAAR